MRGGLLQILRTGRKKLAAGIFSRKEIEENSPSRRDRIDLKRETFLRRSYSKFLQHLGMRLQVPQITIATAIIFCHRFFLCQSHAKNDRRSIVTACMFLAGKVEETPRPLKDVILVSYEIIHQKQPAVAQRIKQKQVYERQKELILLGERVVLATLGFDLNVHHPYKFLVEVIKKFPVAQNDLAQVAWNFVNDGLRTSLCLQYKPHHIAAGAIFLAAKFLKVKLPSDGEVVWWQAFDVTPRQLEDVSNQMLELYYRLPLLKGSEVEGSGGGLGNGGPAKTPSVNKEHASKQALSCPSPEQSHAGNCGVLQMVAQNQSNDNSSVETESVITDHMIEVEKTDNNQFGHVLHTQNMRAAPNKFMCGAEQLGGEDQEWRVQNNAAESAEWRDDAASHKPSSIVGQDLDLREGPVGQSPKEAIKIDKDKWKAAFKKRKKSRGEMAWRKDVMDEEDLIEKELEDGVELAAEDEKLNRERITENPDYCKDHGETGDGNCVGMKQQCKVMVADNAEKGEMLDYDVSPISNNRKRKASWWEPYR